jgi:hypothetical protein|tara:strand:+ start:49 stop:438 length:390 start_codon:yes stop_codon:yes gene_type:complete
MGTRSLTYVYVEDTPIMCMYRQFDGYPSGHGVELAEFLTQIEMGNGISGEPELFSFANGMGCLAAQMIVNFKKSPGGFYIYPVELDQACWQEYEYHVYEKQVVVKNPTEVIFEGSYEEFMSFCYDKVTE